ncbi:MAG: nucleotidyltransferase family protein [Actinobacteria bacterium]|nr:nucleotidyltransferase family protein [Actinomycetota bacterium]
MVGTRETPVWVMVHLTHAAIQLVADRASADILHIKGPTDAPLRAHPHYSTDTDVLVRPAHMDRFLDALEADGWSRLTDFDNGSPFGHAANFEHSAWAAADVHRMIPGLSRDPAEVFDRLWEARQNTEIGHRACSIPAPPAQVLIQVTHVARSHGATEPETWTHADEQLRSMTRALAAELGGDVAFAAGLGELDAFRDARDYALWKHWSAPEDNRVLEWAARLRSAHGLRARARIIVQAMGVNRARLRMQLGHEPTRREIAAEQRDRIRHALSSGVAAIVGIFPAGRGPRGGRRG